MNIFDEGACRGHDTNWWFPMTRNQSRSDLKRSREQAVVAKSICRGCKVRLACLQYAQDNNEQHGIWGGLDEKERGWVRVNRRRMVNTNSD